MLISPQAIKDCIRLMEAKSQLKREVKVAVDARPKRIYALSRPAGVQCLTRIRAS